MYTFFHTLIKANSIIDALFKLLQALKHLIMQAQNAFEQYEQLSFAFEYDSAI
jgi:hypothetical protein